MLKKLLLSVIIINLLMSGGALAEEKPKGSDCVTFSGTFAGVVDSYTRMAGTNTGMKKLNATYTIKLKEFSTKEFSISEDIVKKCGLKESGDNVTLICKKGKSTNPNKQFYIVTECIKDN
jgi:hypothetical protein